MFWQMATPPTNCGENKFRATHPKWRSMFVQGLKLWFNLSLLKEYDKLGKSGGKECWDACLPMNCVTFVSLFYFKLTSELLPIRVHVIYEIFGNLLTWFGYNISPNNFATRTKILENSILFLWNPIKAFRNYEILNQRSTLSAQIRHDVVY